MVLEDLQKPKWRQNSRHQSLCDSPITMKIPRNSTRRSKASHKSHIYMHDEESISFLKSDAEMSPTVVASPGSTGSETSRLFSYDPSFDLSPRDENITPNNWECSKQLQFLPLNNSARRMYIESEQRQTAGFASNSPTERISEKTKHTALVPLLRREQGMHRSISNRSREAEGFKADSRNAVEFPTGTRPSQVEKLRQRAALTTAPSSSNHTLSKNFSKASSSRQKSEVDEFISNPDKQRDGAKAKDPGGFYRSSRNMTECSKSSSVPESVLPARGIPCRSSQKSPVEYTQSLKADATQSAPVIDSNQNESRQPLPPNKKQKLWRRLLFRRKMDKIPSNESDFCKNGTDRVRERPKDRCDENSADKEDTPKPQTVDTLCQPRRRRWPWSKRKKTAEKEFIAPRVSPGTISSKQSIREKKTFSSAPQARPGLDPVFCPAGKETTGSQKVSIALSKTNPNPVETRSLESSSVSDNSSSDESDPTFSIEAWSHNLSSGKKDPPQRGRGRSPRHNSTNGRDSGRYERDYYSREVHYFTEPPLLNDETESLSGTTISDTTVVRSNAMSQRSGDTSDLDTSLSSSTMLGRVDENEVDIEPSRLLQRLERGKRQVDCDNASETDSALIRRKQQAPIFSPKKLSPPTKVNCQSIVSMKGTWFSAQDVDVWNIRTEKAERSMLSEPEAEGIEMELSYLTSGSEHSGEFFHDAVDDLTMLQNIKRKLDVFQYSKKKRIGREKGEHSSRAERWKSMLRSCEYESDYSSCCSTVSDSLSDKPWVLSDY